MSNRYLSSLLEYIFTAGGKSTIRRFEFRRQTDINQAKPTRDPFLFSFFFFYLLLFLPFFVASRSHNFLLLAYTTLSRTTKPSFVTLTLYETIIRFNTYTRDACNDKFHPLDDVPPPFPLPIFYSFSSFSRIGMPLTSFNLLGLACFNRTIMAVRIAKDKQESLIEL